MTRAGVHLIASYPKSGNTWVRCLIASLHKGGASVSLSKLGQIVPNAASRVWLEEQVDIPMGDFSIADFRWARAEACRVALQSRLKVHDSYDPQLFPDDAIGGVVLIVRDPRDIVSSWADHMGVDLQQAIDVMADRNLVMSRSVTRFRSQAPQHFGSWSSNTTSWLDDYTGPKLMLRYEDLLASPEGEAARLARFLELPDDAATVAASVRACEFATLSDSEAREGFAERQPNQSRFFRRGRAGAWHRDLSPDHVAQLVRDHGAVMARLGYLPSVP